MLKHFRDFLKLEASGGIFLIVFTLLGIVLSNLAFEEYNELLSFKIGFRFGEYSLHKTTVGWVNDCLMSLFFLLVGLEMKHNLIDGEFSDRRNLILPLSAAIGGALLPVLIYSSINFHDPQALSGWAIPISTDTAFVLGILTMFGKRVSSGTKIFIVGLSIMDDIIAILVLALFYTTSLNISYLLAAVVITIILMSMDYYRVTSLKYYLVLGVLLWFCTYKSGIHGTISGIILSFTIPAKGDGENYSPLSKLESFLQPKVLFLILPLFAFVNTKIPLNDIELANMFTSEVLGIFLGLSIGKPIGILLASYIAIAAGICTLPTNSSWQQYIGISVLCGISFTLSIFISSLAFDEIAYRSLSRLAVILASLTSGVIGSFILYHTKRHNTKHE